MLALQHLWITLLHHHRQVQCGTTPTYPSSIQRKQENPSDWSHCVQQQNLDFSSNPCWYLTFDVKEMSDRDVLHSSRRRVQSASWTESSVTQGAESVCTAISCGGEATCVSHVQPWTLQSLFCCIWLKASCVYLLVHFFVSPGVQGPGGGHERKMKADWGEIVGSCLVRWHRFAFCLSCFGKACKGLESS